MMGKTPLFTDDNYYFAVDKLILTIGGIAVFFLIEHHWNLFGYIPGSFQENFELAWLITAVFILSYGFLRPTFRYHSDGVMKFIFLVTFILIVMGVLIIIKKIPAEINHQSAIYELCPYVLPYPAEKIGGAFIVGGLFVLFFSLVTAKLALDKVVAARSASS